MTKETQLAALYFRKNKLERNGKIQRVRGSCARLIVKSANSKSKSQSTYECVHSRRAGYSL